MAKKKAEAQPPETVANVVADGPYLHHLETLGNRVSFRFLDGGDVEVSIKGEPISFEDGIVLRWGRKRV